MKSKIFFATMIGIQCVATLGLAALMYCTKANDKRSRIIDKANSMKFGIIAAVLVMLAVPVGLVVFGIWKTSMSVQNGFIPFYLFFGPYIAAIISIVGLVNDKYKNLAVLTLLLSMVWAIFLFCWMCTIDL